MNVILFLIHTVPNPPRDLSVIAQDAQCNSTNKGVTNAQINATSMNTRQFNV